MKKLIVMVLLTFFSVPAFGESLPQKQDEFDMVLQYLSSDQFTPNRLEFEDMTSDAVQKLVKVAKTSRYPVALRARAIQTLALYRGDSRATDLITKLMKSTRSSSKLFPAVLVAYAEIHGETVAEEVSSYTIHGRNDVRMAAVIALGRYCGQAGLEHLRLIESKEENEIVRSRIRSYIF